MMSQNTMNKDKDELLVEQLLMMTNNTQQSPDKTIGQRDSELINDNEMSPITNPKAKIIEYQKLTTEGMSGGELTQREMIDSPRGPFSAAKTILPAQLELLNQYTPDQKRELIQ